MDDDIEKGRQRAIEEYRRAIAAYKPEPKPDAEVVKSVVHAALAASPIPELIKSNSAVIWEFQAYGGGGGNWYFCADEASLPAIEGLLHTGSRVSFYFDNRIKHQIDSPETKEIMVAILATLDGSNQLCVGTLKEDSLCLSMTTVCNEKELEDEFEFTSSRQVFFGPEPDFDNDGTNALTLYIPDIDGILRSHAY